MPIINIRVDNVAREFPNMVENLRNAVYKGNIYMSNVDVDGKNVDKEADYKIKQLNEFYKTAEVKIYDLYQRVQNIVKIAGEYSNQHVVMNRLKDPRQKDMELKQFADEIEKINLRSDCSNIMNSLQILGNSWNDAKFNQIVEEIRYFVDNIRETEKLYNKVSEFENNTDREEDKIVSIINKYGEVERKPINELTEEEKQNLLTDENVPVFEPPAPQIEPVSNEEVEQCYEENPELRGPEPVVDTTYHRESTENERQNEEENQNGRNVYHNPFE